MSKLTHLDEAGHAHMVDVSDKAETSRSAWATATVQLTETAMSLLIEGNLKKGDALGVARIAGIMGAKKTAELIPLCHPLSITKVTVDLEPNTTTNSVLINAIVKTKGQTGVEMEALTAVSAALLTIYDMVKAVDKGMTIEGVRLLAKSGGRSGDWHAV